MHLVLFTGIIHCDWNGSRCASQISKSLLCHWLPVPILYLQTYLTCPINIPPRFALVKRTVNSLFPHGTTKPGINTLIPDFSINYTNIIHTIKLICLLDGQSSPYQCNQGPLLLWFLEASRHTLERFPLTVMYISSLVAETAQKYLLPSL